MQSSIGNATQDSNTIKSKEELETGAKILLFYSYLGLRKHTRPT